METMMNTAVKRMIGSISIGFSLSVAGLLAQKVEPFDAASASVYLHTVAAELVSAEIGDRGLLASDLLPKIPRAMLKTQS